MSRQWLKPKKQQILDRKISGVKQEVNVEKQQLVGETESINVDFSILASTVEKNSELLRGVAEELKSLKTEIKELKDDGIKINQEDEGEVIIIENEELNERVRAESEKFVFGLLKKK